MSPQQTIAVAVRLFAIWLAIYAARMLQAFYAEMVQTDDSNATVIAVAIAVPISVFLLFLWFFPRTIAGALLSTKAPIVTEPASPDPWLAVGCALLGLWLIIPALSRLLWNLSVLYLSQRTPSVDTSNITYAWIRVQSAFVFLLVASCAAVSLATAVMRPNPALNPDAHRRAFSPPAVAG